MTQNTSSNNKLIAKNTAMLYFRMLFIMFISLFTSRVIIDALGIVDYGIYNVVGGFVAMFALVSNSLTSACSRFISYEIGIGSQESIQKVFTTTIIIHYLLAIIIAILCEGFGLWYINNKMLIPVDRLLAANYVFHISVLNFCTNLITIPYNAAIIAHNRMKIFAYVSIFEGLGRLAICYLVMYVPSDRLVSYAWFYLGIQFIVRLIYQYYCRKKIIKGPIKFVFDVDLLKRIFSYSGWHIIGNSIALVNRQGADLILNSFFGPVLNAAKGISNQVLAAVSGFAGNFMVALNPQITQSYARGDYSYMINLIDRGARFSFYMMLMLSLPIILNTDYILEIWLNDVPEFSSPMVKISLITAMVGVLSNTLIVAQNATGKIRTYQIVIGGILLLNLPASFFFLKFGASPLAVLIVALFIEVCCLIGRLVVIRRNINAFNSIDYLIKVVGNCCKVALISSIIPVIVVFYMGKNIYSFLIVSVISVICTAIVIAFIGCSKGERKFLFELVKSKVFKK